MIQVSSKLYRGARPTTVGDFALIKATHITTVISLQGNLLEWIDGDVSKELENYRGSFFWEPLSSFFSPAPWEVGDILDLIDDAPGLVLVHCKQGVDRTGFIVAAHRMRHGWSYARAKTEMYAMGFHWWYFYWLPALKRWAR